MIEEEHNFESRCRVNVERMQLDCGSLLQELRHELQKLFPLDAHSFELASSRFIVDADRKDTSSLLKHAAVDAPPVSAQISSSQTAPVILTVEDVYPSPPRSLVEEVTEDITTPHTTADDVTHYAHKSMQNSENYVQFQTGGEHDKTPDGFESAGRHSLYSWIQIDRKRDTDEMVIRQRILEKKDQQPPSARDNASAGMTYSHESPSPMHESRPVSSALDVWTQEQMLIRMSLQQHTEN